MSILSKYSRIFVLQICRKLDGIESKLLVDCAFREGCIRFMELTLHFNVTCEV